MWYLALGAHLLHVYVIMIRHVQARWTPPETGDLRNEDDTVSLRSYLALLVLFTITPLKGAASRSL